MRHLTQFVQSSGNSLRNLAWPGPSSRRLSLRHADLLVVFFRTVGRPVMAPWLLDLNSQWCRREPVAQPCRDANAER